MALEGGHRFIKYLLIIFNFIFLLAGLALVIIGSVAAAKLTPYSSLAGVSYNGVGIFIIIVGVVIFLISLFGCLGAYKENYCLLVTFVILMSVSLLALIVAIITAFVMRNKVYDLIEKGFNSTIPDYGKEKWITKILDQVQTDEQCCGSKEYTDWQYNKNFSNANSIPDTCCKKIFSNCGRDMLDGRNKTNIYTDMEHKAFVNNFSPLNRMNVAMTGLGVPGCSSKVSGQIFKNVVAVGGAAAAIAILQFIGIVFACCLVRALRKEYSTV